MIPQSLSLSIYRVCPTHPSSIHLSIYPSIMSIHLSYYLQTTSDGCSSILEKAVIEHNMTAIARIYDNICFTELAAILSMDVRRAEKVGR